MVKCPYCESEKIENWYGAPGDYICMDCDYRFFSSSLVHSDIVGSELNPIDNRLRDMVGEVYILDLDDYGLLFLDRRGVVRLGELLGKRFE